MAAKTDNEKIRKQVNFYFSDSNLPYDKFLWGLHSNAVEGWIPLSVIANFKRIKMITEDIEVVLNALREEESQVYKISENGQDIKRKGEVIEHDITSRSVHAKGFPLVDADNKNSLQALFELQDKIDDLFNEKAKVLATRLKKDDRGKFKGSVYVEFENNEEAMKVADLSEIEFDGQKITLTYRPTYHKLKQEEFKDKPKSKKRSNNFNAFRPPFTFKRKQDNNQRDRGNKRGKFNKKNGHVKRGEEEVKTEENKAEDVKTENKPVEEKAQEIKAEEKNE